MNFKQVLTPQRLIYAIAVYVFLQFAWWAYLLMSQSQVLYDHQASRRIWMILGEGFIFMTLLCLAFAYVLRVWRRERQLQEEKQNFLWSVTHELKTPIASLKLAMQTLLKSEKEPSAQTFLYQSSLEQTNRLHRLVDNILQSSTLENASYVVHFQQVDIARQLNQIVTELSQVYQRPKASVFLEITEGEVYTDLQAFESIAFNLIENAMKYSTPDDKISIQFQSLEDHYKLSVKDQGIGISASEKNKIFDLFYRVGHENTRSKKGTGLGLYIVQKMSQALNAEIKVLDNVPKGSIFTIIFPRHA